MKGVDGQKVLLFASQTGCEQRTLERHPSFQAVLRYVQSVERKEELDRRWQAAPSEPTLSACRSGVAGSSPPLPWAELQCLVITGSVAKQRHPEQVLGLLGVSALATALHGDGITEEGFHRCQVSTVIPRISPDKL